LKTGNYRTPVPLTVDHNPVVLYSEQGIGAQYAPGYKAPAASTTAPAATSTAAPAATTTATPAAKAATTMAAGTVNYQQQGTIVVQHQGFLSAGGPYPQQ